MNHFRTRGSAAAIALVALLISAFVPATVAAAAPPMSISVYMGDRCVRGVATDDTVVEIRWKDAYGNTKLHTNDAADQDGRWGYCSRRDNVKVRPGDWISATDLGTSVNHLLIVPTLTGFGNRDLDFYKGTGPAGAYLKLICSFSNGFEPCMETWKVGVNSSGKWSLNPGWNVGGGDTIVVQYKTPSGDFVRTIATPAHLSVRIGSPRVVGETRNGYPATVVLKRGSAMDVKATATLASSAFDGSFAGPLKNLAGNKVAVKAGDWITSDISSEIDWIVPDITGQANSSTGHITGKCGDGGTVMVLVYRYGYVDSGDWYWPEDGNYDFDTADGNVIFGAGDQVLVRCEIAAGDWVERMFTAI